jgi:hypothetical protein
VKTKYRKVLGVLLTGAACLVTGCQSLLPGVKKSALRADCRWLEFPYSFQCDYSVDIEGNGDKEPVPPNQRPKMDLGK